MAKIPMRVSAVGIPWFAPDTFDQLRAMMTDSHLLSPTYEKWHERALHSEEQLRRAGHTVIRVDLDPDEFTTVCRARGLNLDAKGRMEFASFKAAQALEAQGRGDT